MDNKGDYNDAMVMYENVKAIKEAPQPPLPTTILEVCCKNKGDYTGAKKVYKTALKIQEAVL
jgi:Tfp pilus assembly protein PilF